MEAFYYYASPGQEKPFVSASLTISHRMPEGR